MTLNKSVSSNPLYFEKIHKLLFKYGTPSVISMLVGSLYNIVDQIFIGQGIGINGNAATNVAFPLTIICIFISLFIGVGGASLYSIMLGSGENKNASVIIGNTVTLSFLFGIALSLIVKLLNKKLMIIFGSTNEILEYAYSYADITSYGFTAYIFTMVMSYTVRADGNPKYSMAFVLSGAVINTILDPIFIFVFKMGMPGAALATVIGQYVSFFVAFIYLFKFKNIKLEKSSFILKYKQVLKIFALGASAGFSNLSMMILQIVMNNVLSSYGSSSIYGGNIPLAVSGIAAKINMIVMSFVIGTSQGSQPIIGFNYGAKNYDRVIDTYKLTMTITAIITFIAFLLFQLFPRQIVSVFGNGSKLYFQFSEKYMRIFMMLMIINAAQPVTGTFFSSLGKAFKGAFLAVTRQTLFLLPLIIILPKFFGIDGVMYAGPIADGAALIVTIILVSIEIKNIKKLKENIN
ncbi:MATE family efflux transporter [uncultured Brachyspira sp.]|uniref:MATE family efflux transporter n=1 Tax=uncultured Brachyspira sp. TaxID=221953 RepID=UPI0025F4354C|nr:MATE family efflux transporter [uncultured Brachyspira sp.]